MPSGRVLQSPAAAARDTWASLGLAGLRRPTDSSGALPLVGVGSGAMLGYRRSPRPSSWDLSPTPWLPLPGLLQEPHQLLGGHSQPPFPQSLVPSSLRSGPTVQLHEPPTTSLGLVPGHPQTPAKGSLPPSPGQSLGLPQGACTQALIPESSPPLEALGAK